MTLPLGQSPARRWLIAGLILTLLCGALLPVALNDLQSASAAQRWPQVRGVVTHSGIAMGSVSSGRLGSERTFAPDVRYTYAVGGRNYSAARVHRDKGPNSEAGVRALAAKYPVGAAVSVFYDPGNPADAVLETEIHGNTLQAVLAFGGGLAFGILCLLRFRLLRRRERGLNAFDAGPPRPNRRERRRQKKVR